MTVFQRFLQIPSLDLASESFPYACFETSSMDQNSDGLSIPEGLMIGKQAEKCFEHYLKTSERYDVLASNIQIQGPTETMGELDYLVYDKELQQNLHVELACKFYLLDPRKKNLSAWIGPNRKDSLHEKAEKLRLKQFPILFAKETTALLEQVIPDVMEIEQQLCLKAFLFLPKGMQAIDISDGLRGAVIGEWMDIALFEEEDLEAVYALPQKTQWLHPPEHIQTWYSKKQIMQRIQEQHKNKKTPLVYQKSNGALKLFFIVWWI